MAWLGFVTLTEEALKMNSKTAINGFPGHFKTKTQEYTAYGAIVWKDGSPVANCSQGWDAEGNLRAEGVKFAELVAKLLNDHRGSMPR